MGLVIKRLSDKIKSLNQRTGEKAEEHQLNLIKEFDSSRKIRLRIEEEENGSAGMTVVQILLSEIISAL